jgi:UPF0755 protein
MSERTPDDREAARLERMRRRGEAVPEPSPAPEPAAAPAPAPRVVPAAVEPEPAPDLVPWPEHEPDRPAGTRFVTGIQAGFAPRAASVLRHLRPGRGRRVLRSGLAIAFVVLLGALAWFFVSLYQPFHGKGKGTVVVRIPRGASARDIGDLLAKRGVVASGLFFSLRSSITGDRSDLRNGRFVLRHGMSYGAALKTLTAVPKLARTFAVTIPEGRSIREESPRIKHAGIPGSYAKAAAVAPPKGYGAPASIHTLEGFLFPDTYQLKQGSPASVLVKKQLKALRQNLAGVSLKRAHKKNLTAFDVLTIASMIEREAATEKDRPLIAAVIYNRLHDHIPLGIDATTRFALNNWSRPLKNSDFPRSGRYDTRHYQGLPPGPIGSPGLASIQAAANPARVGYLYYVARPGTCDHVFTKTFAQFEAAVARYNAARAKKGGKSPTTC